MTTQQSLPVIALVGRPNVGKSTLFNALTRSRDALVADYPGLTRDRKYGRAEWEERQFLVVDTGGLADAQDAVNLSMQKQVWLAVEEADLVLFLLDARDGLTPADEEILERLRRCGKPVLAVVNKVDGLDERTVLADFYALGMPLVGMAAAHRRGIHALMEEAVATLGEARFPRVEEEPPLPDAHIRLAVLGRPNVGKSTLINRLLGEERMVTMDLPGTTRDTVEAEAHWEGRDYTLIDTAGVRRRARIDEKVEKFSVIKALQAVEQARAVVLVIDAREGVTEQDLHLLGHIVDAGRALVIAVNKWDGMDQDARQQVKRELDRKLAFCDYARRVTISALHGSGLKELMKAVEEAYDSAGRNFSTHALTELLQQAVQAHTPPIRQGRAARLRYAHSGGVHPPRIIVHGNRTETLPPSYIRYLSNHFRKAFKLVGTPLILEFRTSDNPFKGRKNKLTARQIQKRKRLKKFTQRKK